MRILKGYSKAEKKELKALKKLLDINDLLNIITGNLADRGFNPIWEKYNKADTNERISIIRDILDFYTDKATFAKPKKYYVKFSKIGYPYLIQTNYGIELVRYLKSGYKEEFTEQEIKAMDPRYMAFAVPVEADDE